MSDYRVHQRHSHQQSARNNQPFELANDCFYFLGNAVHVLMKYIVNLWFQIIKSISPLHNQQRTITPMCFWIPAVSFIYKVLNRLFDTMGHSFLTKHMTFPSPRWFYRWVRISSSLTYHTHILPDSKWFNHSKGLWIVDTFPKPDNWWIPEQIREHGSKGRRQTQWKCIV